MGLGRKKSVVWESNEALTVLAPALEGFSPTSEFPEIAEALTRWPRWKRARICDAAAFSRRHEISTIQESRESRRSARGLSR